MASLNRAVGGEGGACWEAVFLPSPPLAPPYGRGKIGQTFVALVINGTPVLITFSTAP